MNYDVHCPYCYAVIPWDEFKIKDIDSDEWGAEIQVKAMCEYCRTEVVVSVTGDLTIYTEENGVLH